MTLAEALRRFADVEMVGPYGRWALGTEWSASLSVEEAEQPAEVIAADPRCLWPERIRVHGAGARAGAPGSRPCLLVRGDSGILFTVRPAAPLPGLEL